MRVQNCKIRVLLLGGKFVAEVNKDTDLYIKSAAFDRFVDFITVMIEKYGSSLDIDDNQEKVDN